MLAVYNQRRQLLLQIYLLRYLSCYCNDIQIHQYICLNVSGLYTDDAAFERTPKVFNVVSGEASTCILTRTVIDRNMKKTFFQ